MVKGVPTELAPTFRRLRGDLPQAELVAQAQPYGGIASGTVAEIEMGRRGLSREKAQIVAQALGLSAEQFRELLVAAGHDPDNDGTIAQDVLSRLDRLEARFDRLEALVRRETSRRRGAR